MSEPAFLEDFLLEADQLLSTSQSALLQLHQEENGRARRLLVDEVFRAIHTLKGLSGMVGLQPAVEVTHVLESFLGKVRMGQTRLTSASLDLVLEATRTLGDVVSTVRGSAPAAVPTGLMARLEALLQEQPREAPEPPPADLPAEIPQDVGSTLSTTDRQDIEAALQRGERVQLVTFAPSQELNERGLNVSFVRGSLEQTGEILKAVPLIEGKAIRFVFLVQLAPETVLPPLEGTEVVELTRPDAPEVAAPAPEDLSGYFAHRGRAAAGTLRVPKARLDEVMNLLGDLMVTRSRLQAEIQRLPRAAAAMRLCERLQRQLGHLREAVTRVRMVPLAEVFERMPLAVRELARASGREVEVQLLGAETQIDKTIVDQLVDPLLHLVRNAVTHGLESPEERLRAGKPGTGRLVLRGEPQGDSIVITVSDDGRGLDRRAILQRAGLSAEQDVSDERLLSILCRPGFSTRAEVDAGAGRGVGMDVVRSSLEELSGTLSVSSRPGEGTTFTLSLPVTLAVLHSFIVTVGEERYAIARDSVDEIAEIREADIVRHEGRELTALRGQSLGVVRLRELLGLAPPPAQERHFALIHAGTAVIVDRVVNLEEVVVRAMDDPLVARPYFSGVTELGDGSLALIPYLPKLLARIS